MHYEPIIAKLVKLWVRENNFKTVTVIAPGSRWAPATVELQKIIEVEKVYDKDPQLIDLPYTNADVIFDDIEINSDAIITFHGEKLYPPTRVFKGNHFLVVRESDDHKNCTNLDKLSHEQTFMEMSTYGPFYVFTGEIKDVESVHIPMYTSLQDRAE